MNNIYFIIISIICMFYIIFEIRKKRLSIKESFWWFIGSVLMLVLSIFPEIIDKLAKIVNVTYPPSLLFVLCIVFLIMIIFKCSKRISILETKVIDLAQEIAILKDMLNEKK